MAKRIRNNSLVSDLEFTNIVAKDSELTKKRKPSRVPSQQQKFLKKLENEDFQSFTYLDWRDYFRYMYKQVNGMNYNIDYKTFNAQIKSVFTSLVNKYSWIEIKTMIDFLFLADHNHCEHKQVIHFNMLSSKYVLYVYPNAMLWKEGKYKKSNKKPKRDLSDREWTTDTSIDLSDDDIF